MNGNQLKILALAAMTLDHIGYILFPQVLWLRVVGRLAFPIFAFMVAEGCFYTRDKRRYLATMCAFAAGIQLAYWVCMHSLYQSIMTTLALSVATVFTLQRVETCARERKGTGTIAAAMAGVAGMLAVDALCCLALPGLLGHGFGVDYGLCGVLLPVFAYLPRLFREKAEGENGEKGVGETDGAARKRAIGKRMRRLMLASFAAGLVLLCVALDRPAWHVQWFCLLSLVPLAFYDGTRGRLRMKYLFYVYYPAHLAVLYGIGVLTGLC